MGGGLMQLVAYGAQDIYLTGNPQITFFKVVYRRHTNFSMEDIKQTFNGSVGDGNRVTATISRNGDLVHKMYLEANLTASHADQHNIGHSIIDQLELEIGGQKIDKHYGRWMQIWSDLTEVNPTGSGVPVAGTAYAGQTLWQKMSGNGDIQGTAAPHSAYTFYIPLLFWFCRNPGLALPLIALQYHEVKVNLTFSGAAAASNTTSGCSALEASDVNLWAQYIYLDTDERRRFAQVSHEYLIEQLQFQDSSVTWGQTSVTDNNIDLHFNHPVKELVWAFGATATENNTNNATYCAAAPGNSVASLWDNEASTFQLKLNGHDRFGVQKGLYFTRKQVYDHHSGFGGIGNITDKVGLDGICVYSFALKPEEHQPSGTCNFSRIDNAQLVSKLEGGHSTTPEGANIYIYAVNYNVLRIMSGMGGLAYSN